MDVCSTFLRLFHAFHVLLLAGNESKNLSHFGS